MPVISIVHKEDVLNEAIKTKYYFDIRSILYAMGQEEVIDPNGNLYADNLKYRAKGRDCYDTVVDILAKLGASPCSRKTTSPSRSARKCPKCGFQDPRYGEMTNRRYLESLSDHDFAALLIVMCEEETVEYDWDENPTDGYPYTFWRTSDAEEFSDRDEAIDHEVWWLRQPYGEEMR